jgi:hypothetical protein
VSGAAASAASDPFAAAGPQPSTPGAAGTPGASTRRPSRSGRSSRAAARRAAASAAGGDTGQTGTSYDTRRSTGSFPSTPATGSYGTQPAADPLGISASTGPFGAPSYDSPAATGPFATQGGAGSSDVRATGGYDTPSSSIPATGSFATGSYDPARTSGAFEAATPAASPADALADPAPRATGGSFDAWAATSYETPRSDAYDASRTATGPFRAADASASYPPDPAVTGPETGGTDPGWPVAGSYPPVAAAPTTGSSSWPNARDVLDDPEPPRGASSWPNAETYQTPAYDGYASTYPAGSQPPSPAAPSTPSYEVSTGWATIDASDTVTGPGSATASPYESAGYDAPSGQSQYGYDQQQQQGYGGTHPSWPEQPAAGGSWPAYDEVYGDAPTSASGRRRGSRHRDPESDYPDYYR